MATTTAGAAFEKRKAEELAFENGRVFVKADSPAGGVPFADLLRRANIRLVTGNGKSEATFGDPKPKFSTHSFGCHFVEVTWQPEIARLRVSRVVTVMSRQEKTSGGVRMLRLPLEDDYGGELFEVIDPAQSQ